MSKEVGRTVRTGRSRRLRGKKNATERERERILQWHLAEVRPRGKQFFRRWVSAAKLFFDFYCQ
ncbi:hypothetical protein TRIP_B50169 [uncultured Desulfatiglans sp.]|uniref:Uncharacterized protein n=1 Tax=Uncultured Desulfatiglans sp. TaxID=1748965 RepID=A0A653AHJ2_UNCDX|nr:hypothetical protein TRIP_B50169 [uncultured Desulfatiglans sp.]